MHSFTEYYRLRWFALEIAQGSFSYLWYGGHFTWEHDADRYTYHAGY